MRNRTRRPPTSRQVLTFWGLVAAVSLVLAALAFAGGKYWVGGLISGTKLDKGAPRIAVQARDDQTSAGQATPDTAAAAPEKAVVKMEERAPTDGERGELETKSPQDGAGLNQSGQDANKPDESVGSDTKPLADDQSGSKADTGSSSADQSSPQTSSAHGRGYTVNAGAYADPANAEKEVERLSARGYSPYVVQITRHGRVLHRVSVGFFSERRDAERLQERLRTEGTRATISSD